MYSRLLAWRRAFVALFPIIAFSVALCTPARADVPAVGGTDSVRVPQPAASVYGTDSRQAVQDTTHFPFSAIGLVEVQVGWEFYIGTGVMIGRYMALTCGHVVNGDETNHANNIEFVPGEDGGQEPFGRAKVIKVIPAPQWASYRDDGYDIAILVLDRPVGDRTGYFQIAVQPNAFFDAASLTTAGYPTDWGGYNPITVSGRSYGMDGNVIIHDLDSEPGQSGSPIWYGGNDSTARLVGLLEGSYLTSSPFGTGTEGIAARIDQQTANWIDEQLAAHNDVSQDITGEVTDASTTRSGSLCGFGSMQALLGGALAYTACFVSRRRRV